MNYFPMFVSLSGERCLVVGGGEIALHKVKKLLPFGAEITVVAKEWKADFSHLPIEKISGEFREEMLSGVFLVVAATGDGETNGRIARLCKERKIPVNSVDDKDNCSFLFPALITRGEVTVGVSTGGASPYLAGRLRQKIEEVLPPDLGEICSLAAAWRSLPAEEYKKKVEDALDDQNRNALV